MSLATNGNKRLKRFGDFEELPQDIWSVVASFMDNFDWYCMALISKHFNSIFESTQIIQEIHWNYWDGIILESCPLKVTPKYKPKIMENIKNVLQEAETMREAIIDRSIFTGNAKWKSSSLYSGLENLKRLCLSMRYMEGSIRFTEGSLKNLESLELNTKDNYLCFETNALPNLKCLYLKTLEVCTTFFDNLDNQAWLKNNPTVEIIANLSTCCGEVAMFEYIEYLIDMNVSVRLDASHIRFFMKSKQDLIPKIYWTGRSYIEEKIKYVQSKIDKKMEYVKQLKTYLFNKHPK